MPEAQFLWASTSIFLKPVAFEELEEVVHHAVERVEEIISSRNRKDMTGIEEMSDPVRVIKEYLEIHYNEVITRKNIESLVHLNGDYVNREFRKYTGCTFMEYIRKYRIDYGKKVLEGNIDVHVRDQLSHRI